MIQKFNNFNESNSRWPLNKSEAIKFKEDIYHIVEELNDSTEFEYKITQGWAIISMRDLKVYSYHNGSSKFPIVYYNGDSGESEFLHGMYSRTMSKDNNLQLFECTQIISNLKDPRLNESECYNQSILDGKIFNQKRIDIDKKISNIERDKIKFQDEKIFLDSLERISNLDTNLVIAQTHDLETYEENTFIIIYT